MQSDEDVKNNILKDHSGNRFMFDFEQFKWNSQQPVTYEMGKNAHERIENERLNIEKDLKILEAIKKERSKQEKLMVSLLQIREELENKLKSTSKA